MTPGSPSASLSPLSETCVALDLETTGLDPERDEIIEVGAVKFRGTEVVDTFHTLLNPYVPISSFIQRFTGIAPADVRGAPSFAAVAGELLSFVSDCPLVGHNIKFDIAFLARSGLRLANRQYDTLDLASVFLPVTPDLGLARLARALGLTHQRPHRALEDAEASRQVFLNLVSRALEMDAGVLEALGRVAERSPWPFRYLLRGLGKGGHPASVGMLGVDLKDVARRLERPRSLAPNQECQPLDEEYVASLLSPDGPLARRFSGYEYRAEQVAMLRSVVRAFNAGEHLVVEGGTGIGKSVAYLLPALLYATKNNARVVVSTNTINLQEQLIHKDIPALVEALRDEPGLELSAFRYTPLKGKANYLCLRRWSRLATADTLTLEEARTVAQLLVWLQDTRTGDRAELNLASRDAGIWDRLSAQGFAQCPGAREGACFYRSAREQAAAAHILVVNHALLLSDLALGGALLPDYDYLIIDEAQHLEEEATRQFGFQVSQRSVEELAAQVERFVSDLRSAFRGSSVAAPRQESLERDMREAESVLLRVREHWGRLCAAFVSFLGEHQEETADRRNQLRLTQALRAQPAWSETEIAWDNFEVALGGCSRRMDQVTAGLEGLDEATLPSYDTLSTELANWLQSQEELREHVKEFTAHPNKETIYWLGQAGSDGAVTLNGAPLHVGPLLEERLFTQKRSVVLTSATLSTQGTFQHIRDRVGLTEGAEALLGSPFDYPRSVLLFVPEDMPAPTAGAYQEALQRALADLARAADGRTLALFTSHSALQAARRGLQGLLEGESVSVMGQGVDGSPRRLLKQFQEDPRMVLLGTASFWEGVDVTGGALKVLAVTRLPFNVPTEPVFAARSEVYEDPFTQYAVPQAVLRFRQGFGRLIRSREDRGVVVVLDRRIASKSYGAAFLNSIPRCTFRRGLLRELPSLVRQWLGEGTQSDGGR